MSRWRGWRAWGEMAVGVAFGAAAVGGVGCRTPDRPSDPPPYTALYPGLPPTAAGRSEPPPSAPAPVAVTPAAFQGPRTTNRPTSSEGVDPAPAESADTIDLGVALRLAGVDNPTINLAREQVREALAGQLAARSILLPSFNFGGNYRYHDGPLQDDPGEFRTPRLQSLYLGFGSMAVGTNPAAIPGVRVFAHLGDAVYEPLAARQRVATRRSDAQAVQNQTLLDVAVAYLNLIGAEARVDIFRRAEGEVAEIARITAAFAETGVGAPPDANRAEANTDLIRRQRRQAEGAVAVASARLCRLLNLDPSTRLRTPGGPVEVIRLIPETADLEVLVATAVQARPELASRTAAIREAQVRVRQERARPLLPTLSVGYSAGLFGGVSNIATQPSGPMTGRTDLDVIAVWNIQNFGFGNLSRVRTAGAVVGQSVAALDVARNQVRSEVTAALADARAGARQIELTRAALAAAEEGYRLEAERVRRGEARPIEALDSFRQLVDARVDVLTAVVAFDTAEFRLLVALGNTPVDGPGCAPAGP